VRPPDGAPIYVILDNLSAHKGDTIPRWAKRNRVELCFTPTYVSWANRSRPTSDPCSSAGSYAIQYDITGNAAFDTYLNGSAVARFPSQADSHSPGPAHFRPDRRTLRRPHLPLLIACLTGVGTETGP
jgi:hypothetical protein